MSRQDNTVTDGAGDHPSGGGRDADRRLVDEVRPEDWTNPEPLERYDLVVVGGGTGGLVTAAIGSALGASVALVERHRLGGDCLNYGCVPSKALIRASRSWAEARTSADRFGGPGAAGGGDFRQALERMRRIRADIAHVDGAGRFTSLGVDVFFGEARFDAEDSVSVGDARLRFRRAVLATGARPSIPPIPGLAGADPLTNETVFDVERAPERLIVLGAGPIGCELAQTFARFGSRVTLMDMEPRILPREEEDAAAVVQAALARDGVRFLGGARIVEVRDAEGSKTVVVDADGTSEEVSGDEILVALGRTPNVDMDLGAAGIAHGRGGVQVDDRLRTTNRRVYAVGDVASRFQFTHVADAQARMVVRNALFLGRSKASDLVVPWATYTSPELARVGLSPGEAEARGFGVDSVTVPLSELDRARLDGETEGFLRVHLRAGKDEILGATWVGPHAGDLVAPLSQAITLGTGLEALGDVILPYPTMAEALRKAADQRRRRRLTSRVKWAFEQYLRVWRRLT